MQLTSFLADLKQIIPQDDFGPVIAGLRQDPLVWQALSQPEILAQAVENADGLSKLWNPATLSLIFLGKIIPLENLRSLPLLPISTDLRQRAARTYEETIKTSAAPKSLGEAGLLALALRERRRLTDSWQGLVDELQFTPANPSLNCWGLWHTPLACLYAMSPDPVDLLKALLPDSASYRIPEQVALAQHAILSNPLTLHQQVTVMVDLLSEVDPEAQLAWLTGLSDRGRFKLAGQLATVLLQSNPATAVLKSASRQKSEKSLDRYVTDNLLSLRDTVDTIIVQRQLAKFYQTSGRLNEAVSLLHNAQQELKALQADLSSQIAATAVHNQDHEGAIAALKQAVQALPDSIQVRAELASLLIDSGRVDEAAAILPPHGEHPLALLASARLASNSGDLPHAKEIALGCARTVSNASQEKSSPSSLLNHDHLVELGRLLSELQLVEQSIQVANQALAIYPEDPAFLDILSHAHQLAGNLSAASHAIQLALSFAPDDVDLHRNYASILGDDGDWECSLAERLGVIRLASQPTSADFLSAAQAAIQAKQPAQAVSICQDILQSDPEEGMAHAYLGEAYALMDDPDQAILHFTQATLLNPENPSPWLAMARIYEESGDHYKNLDTLRSAALASPDSAEIHLGLGQAYLADGSPTEALPSLRRAADLSPQTPLISLRLGETLIDLGRLSEAKSVLERGREFWPAHKDLAFSHAKTLLGLGETETALSALETTLQANPDQAEPYLTYGRALVELADKQGTWGNLSNGEVGGTPNKTAAAVPALRKAIEIDPDNLEGHVLLAEALAASGDLQEAFSTYQELSEQEITQTPEWSWRIHLGLGRVAIALKQMDTAIAALQEAAQIKPENLQIHQSLAEAYLAANLPDDALQKGRDALHLAPHDIQNLAWYSRLAVGLKNPAEAIQALEQAAQVTPHRSDLLLQLASIQIQQQDTDSAQDTLKSILFNEQASTEELQQAARFFRSVGDTPSAILALEKALGRSPAKPAEIWAELASLQRSADNQPAALEAIQKAVEINPDAPEYYVIEGDLQYALNQPQAALSSLESALQSLEMTKQSHQDTLQGDSSSSSKTESDTAPWKVHLRVAKLQRAMGDLVSAGAHAEKAVELAPDQPEARYFSADLAHALLEFDRAISLTDGSFTGDPYNIFTSSEGKTPESQQARGVESQRMLKMLCLQAELRLENDDLEPIAYSISRASDLSSTYPRLLAAQARLEARCGDYKAAEQLLEKAISNLNGTENSADGSSSSQNAASSPNPETLINGIHSEYPTLAIAEAALELQQWEVAMPLFFQAARTAPLEPLPHLSLARALVRAAEKQHEYQMLHASQHAPGEDRLKETWYQQFEKAILTANRLSSSEEIARWHKRGQAVFHPGPHTAKLIDAASTDLEDIQALISALVQMGNKTGGIDISRPFDDHREVLFQQALIQIETDPQKSLTAAKSVVERQPNHPLHQALLAFSANAAGDRQTAIQAIERALEYWPNEPEWHAFAAGLYTQQYQPDNALTHWKHAFNLDPENPIFALQLGETFLECGDSTRGIQTLEQATQLDPRQIEAWTALAHAYSSESNYTQATACAERAIALAPHQTAPLVLSGEIALESGQIDLAVERAEAALAADPADARALLLFALTKKASGKPEEALNTIETSLPSLANPYPVLLERAHLIRTLRSANAALEVLHELVEQYPDEPESLGLLADVLAETGQREAAEKAAQSAIMLQPNHASLHLLLGRIQRSSGQLDQAVHHLAEAVRLEPGNIEALIELGRVYQDRREHSQALKVYQQAYEIAPTDARPYYQAGLAFKDSKDYVNAEAKFRRAAELAPEDLNIRRQLGAMIALNLVHNPQEASISQ
ncbi:MAG: tetratricopeptide repeat protein [Chloroflexi bacterium]|nr:tetratricopeptide repeat protein [Chloroflexota bacterium]